MTELDAVGIVVLLLGTAVLFDAWRHRRSVTRTALVVAHDALGMWITVHVQAPGYPDLSSLEWSGDNLPSPGETIRVHHPPDRPYPLRFGSAPRAPAALAGGVLVAVGFGLLLWGG